MNEEVKRINYQLSRFRVGLLGLGFFLAFLQVNISCRNDENKKKTFVFSKRVVPLVIIRIKEIPFLKFIHFLSEQITQSFQIKLHFLLLFFLNCLAAIRDI